MKFVSSRALSFILALLFGLPALTAAQVEHGVIRIQISPEFAPQVAAMFSSTRPAMDRQFAHTDIHSAAITDGAVLESTLGIPQSIRLAKLQPWLPTHSIAFPDIRRRSNPDLFVQPLSVRSTRNAELASAEERVSRWFTLRFDTSLSVDAVIATLRKSHAITQIEKVVERHPCYLPNDTLIPQQYSLPMMHVFEAWDVVRCDSSMLVADVDLGADWSHPDLEKAVYVNPGEIGVDANGMDKHANGVDDDGNGLIDDWHGWDFDGNDGASPDNDTRSTEAHGTHTTGILAATGDNVGGIAGIAFGSKVLLIKASDESGQSIDFGFEGIAYAADMHAKVVSCSWGGPTHSQAEQDVVDYVYAKDCAIVAAAGNSGIYQDYFPATYNHVLSVGAMQNGGSVAGYSNYNPHVDVTAPGTDVLSTYPGGWYVNMTGTSMACPNAAGVVTLVRAHMPTLSVAQAFEQVRATATPLDTTANAILPVDSTRFDFLGHGLVNAYRAVTDTMVHSVRIDHFTIKDADNNATIEPGETTGIELSVRNYLKPVQALHAKIEVVQGSDVVSVLTPNVSFGAAGTMELIANDPTKFILKAADSVGHNTEVLLKVIFSDSSVGYTRDVDYLHFILNPDYIDLNTNNLTVTFSSKGTIGYNDVIENSQGSGFEWRLPPASIVASGRNVLYQGGLILAVDPQHVVDAVQGNSDYYPDQDFVPVDRVHYVTPDHAKALQQVSATFDDSGADSARRIGVVVQNDAYAFSGPLASNSIIVEYRFHEAPGFSNTTFISGGIFADWDIGLSGAINTTFFDTATGIAMTHRLEAGYPWVGIKLIGPVPSGARLNFHAIRNDGSEGDINTYDHDFSGYEKWLALTEGYPSAGPGDVSNALSYANMTISPEITDSIVAIISLAESQEALRSTVAETEAAWNGQAGVRRVQNLDDIAVYPTPFKQLLHLVLPDAPRTAHVTLLDLLGRTVLSEDVNGSDLTLPTDILPGSYILDVTSGGSHWSRVVVAAP